MEGRKIILGIVIFLFVASNPVWGAEPQISAQSAILIDGDTGEILFSKNPHERRPPASTTKILTAILALEKGRINDVVEISSRAANTGEARINLVAGEKITLENLLYGALLKSGNDACVAIAEEIAPSVEEFVDLMNLKARLLGCYNSNFVNTNGLPNNNHYSSAYDLALIARYGLKNKTFAKIVATKSHVIEWEESGRKRKINNTNKLLSTYPGAIGVKTGTTVKAGQCLVAAAQRGNRNLIAVVLKSKNRFHDARSLLDFGFNNYKNIQLIPKDKEISYHYAKEKIDLELATARDCLITVRKNEELEINYRVNITADLEGLIEQGQTVGKIILYNKGVKIGQVPLYSRKEYQLQDENIFRDFFNFWGGMKKIS